MSESVGIALEDATDGDTCNGLKSGKAIADPTYPETDLCCYQTDQPYHDWCLPCLARKGANRIAVLEAERDEMMYVLRMLNDSIEGYAPNAVPLRPDNGLGILVKRFFREKELSDE